MNEQQTGSRWFEWDAENKRFTFHGTENYIWGEGHSWAKRIGDMTREELIHVIAAAFMERDQARAKLEKVAA